MTVSVLTRELIFGIDVSIGDKLLRSLIRRGRYSSLRATRQICSVWVREAICAPFRGVGLRGSPAGCSLGWSSGVGVSLVVFVGSGLLDFRAMDKGNRVSKAGAFPNGSLGTRKGRKWAYNVNFCEIEAA